MEHALITFANLKMLELTGDCKVVADFFLVALESILFQRGLYPPESTLESHRLCSNAPLCLACHAMYRPHSLPISAKNNLV